MASLYKHTCTCTISGDIFSGHKSLSLPVLPALSRGVDSFTAAA